MLSTGVVGVALASSVALLPASLTGPHAVGFRVDGVRDASRLLDGVPRPIQIAVWYPAAADGGPALAYADYVALQAGERSLMASGAS